MDLLSLILASGLLFDPAPVGELGDRISWMCSVAGLKNVDVLMKLKKQNKTKQNKKTFLSFTLL